LETAKTVGRSLEVDMAAKEDGTVFIGHPLSFYAFKDLPPPNNLPLDTVTSEMKQAGLTIVLDCKDIRVLPTAKEIVRDFGDEHALVHAWAQELKFQPYPPEITVEPHWSFEDLPLNKILELKAETDVPVIISARGLTMDRLTSAEGEAIVQRIINTAEGKVDAVNFNLPEGEAPPLPIMQKLLEHRILTWFNIDKVPQEARPPIFLGASDRIETTSRPQDFAA
jgi:hypothetical protein